MYCDTACVLSFAGPTFVLVTKAVIVCAVLASETVTFGPTVKRGLSLTGGTVSLRVRERVSWLSWIPAGLGGSVTVTVMSASPNRFAVGDTVIVAKPLP